MRKALQPPPLGFGRFLHEISGYKSKRALFDGTKGLVSSKLFSSIPLSTVINSVLSLIVACVCMVGLVRRAYILRLFRWHSHDVERTPMPLTWVPNSVCRQAASIVPTSLSHAPITASLRRRVTTLKNMGGSDENTEGDWVPVGPFATDIGGDEAEFESRESSS